MRDQRLDIGRTSSVVRIDDEVRMLLRNRSSTDGMSLEAAGFDQSRRVVAFGIAEHRTGVGQVERLGRDAPRQQFLDALARASRIAVRKAEPRGGEYRVNGAAVREED